MKSADFRLVSYIGLAVGVLCLCGGVFTHEYYVVQHTFLGAYARYPYREHTERLLGVGIILVVIGAGFYWRASVPEKARTRPDFAKESDFLSNAEIIRLHS